MKPTSMASHVRGYIAHRRKLGFKLDYDAFYLAKFAAFADRTAFGQPLSTALALRWATRGANNRSGHHARRYQSVRNLAGYLAAIDPRTESLPSRLLGPTSFRRQPHIFSRDEVRLMMRRARAVPRRDYYSALRPLTFETVIGLMFCTGLRPAEVSKLRLDDFDPRAHTLVVRQTKCSPQRTLPLHPSVVRALARYIRARRRIIPFGDRLFVCRRGSPMSPKRFGEFFPLLVRGIRPNGVRARVRFADLRHTFATRLIAAWSRRTKPVPHYLALLSRYMGHKQFNATWWYVSPDCSSLRTAADLFERFQREQTRPTS